MKNITFLFLLFPLSAQVLSNPADFRNAYQSAKQALQESATYENFWKMAKAAYEFATHGVADNRTEERKAIYQEGKDAADRARKMNPSGVEGHYWFGVNLGSWAETNGIMASLFAAGDLLSAAEQAARLNPRYLNAAPLALKARVLHKAPGWPVSVGNRDQAEADLRRALTLGGDRNRTVYKFLAELLIDKGNKAEAKALLQKGLQLPADAENPYADNKTVNEMQEILAKL